MPIETRFPKLFKKFSRQPFSETFALKDNYFNIFIQIQTKTIMFRYAFQEFEEPDQQKLTSQQLSECTLDDAMFRCFIHWYTKPEQSLENEKKLLEDLAKQFNVILCLWRISTEDNEIYNMIDLKSIEDVNKLPQFLGQALQVSKATFMKKRFKVLSICIINKFGSFEAEKCYAMCSDCGQEQRLNECCAQFICWKCSKRAQVQCCLYCNNNLIVCPIPLQTVDTCQSKNIYQPMFPYLSLEERFQLMDLIDSEFDFY